MKTRTMGHVQYARVRNNGVKRHCKRRDGLCLLHTGKGVSKVYLHLQQAFYEKKKESSLCFMYPRNMSLWQEVVGNYSQISRLSLKHENMLTVMIANGQDIYLLHTHRVNVSKPSS